MSNPIRVLILEDQAADAELMLHELRQAGFDPDWQRVEVEPDYLAALETHPDLILADWSLPQFSGLRALKLMNERDLDIPFIIASGIIGEEAAIEAMHQGAADYLLKDRLARLGQAVQHALAAKQMREQRRLAEEALRASEQKFRSFFEQLEDAVVLTDERGAIIEWNRGAERIFGQQRTNVVGQFLWEVQFQAVPPERKTPQAYEHLKTTLLEALKTGQGGWLNQLQETATQRSDGICLTIQTMAFPIQTESGFRLGSISRDITERKRVEEALRESEARHRAIYEGASIGIAFGDLDGYFVDINPALQSILGYRLEELRGMTLADITHPDDLAADFALFQETVAGQRQQYQIEKRYFHKDGHIVWGNARITVVRDANGNPEYAIGMIEDITQRKQAEMRIQRQLEHLTALSGIDRVISANFDLKLSLSEILTHVTKELGIDAADILILNSGLQILEFGAERGFRTKAIRKAQVRLGESYAGRVARERQPVQIPNLKDGPDNLFSTTLLTGEGFVCYFGVPLIVKGQVKGVLEVFHRAALEPDPEWFDFLDTLAGQAAIAVEIATLFESLQRSNSELALAYDATIEGWSQAMDLRDKETEGHTRRVTEMTLKLARALGLSEAELVHVRWGALLHDIGKIGVPDGILLKPGPLSEEEWEIMRKHPVYAYNMLLPISYLREALNIPYCHHEKWDGTGYPRGIKGGNIPLEARIFSVVDVWDALTSDRPYRKAWTQEKAKEYIYEQAGKQFDPKVVEIFFREALSQ